MKKMKNTLIFWIVYMAYTFIYVARVNLSIASPVLKELKILDASQIGLLGSCFFVVYAVGRIVNGALSDNVKPWIMLTIGLSGCAISNVLFGFLPPFFAIMLLWIMNAYAQSMLWSSVLCTVSAIYENGEVKKKTSIMVTSVALGNILGIVINSFLITRFGVSFAFFVPGVITIAAALLTFFATKNIGVKSVREKTKTPFVELLKNKELLMMDIAAMFHGVMKENISLWMAVYIVDTYMVDLAQSSLYILLISDDWFGRQNCVSVSVQAV